MEPFRYHLLDRDKREIRIFKLHPAASRDELIAGDLGIVSIDKRPEYDALSYVWGAPTPTVNILVDGVPFSIGPNLYNALLDLRQEHTPLLLWIDAICINQRDTSEREHQVSMMQEIYSQARLVRAWLDEHIDSTAKPFREIQRLRRRGPANYGPLNLPGVLRLFWSSLPFLFYLATGIRRDLTEDHDFWNPVVRIFDNEYWSRLWIQQEILLAQKVVFHFHGDVIPEKGLLRFQGAVKSHNDTVDSGTSRLDHGFRMNMPGYFDTLIEGREHVSYSRVNHGGVAREPGLLFKLFLGSGNLRVTDPRDRLYGCLGLLGKEQRAQITVDYSLNLTSTYAKVFKSHIWECNDLEFLCSTTDSAEAMANILPTWMPAPEKVSILAYQGFERHKHRPSSSRPVGVISSDGIVLSIKGVQVDTVRRAGRKESILRRPIIEWVEEVQGLNRETNFHDDPDALWEKPYFAELFRYGCNDSTYWSIWHRRPPTNDDLKSVLKNTVQWAVETGRNDLDLAGMLRDTTAKQPDSDIIISMCEAVDRSFFFSSSSHQLGIIFASNSHLHAEAGDLIFTVLGCPRPLVLRPSEGSSRQFLLIGSAVLPELANGSTAEFASTQSGAAENDRGTRITNIDLI